MSNSYNILYYITKTVFTRNSKSTYKIKKRLTNKRLSFKLILRGIRMEEKSNYYKNVLQLDDEGELQELFSPFNYIHDKLRTELGTGVGLFKTLPEALKHGDRNEQFSNIQYGVMGVEIPKDKYFYDAEKPLNEQNEYIKTCLFDSYALQILFQFEFRKLNAELEKEFNEKGANDFKTILDSKYNEFYEIKKNILLEIKTGKELIDFIARQTAKNDKDIASAYLCWTGIYGIKTNNNEYPFEYLLFDFQEHASTTGFKTFDTKETEETAVHD